MRNFAGVSLLEFAQAEIVIDLANSEVVKMRHDDPTRYEVVQYDDCILLVPVRRNSNSAEKQG